MTSSYTDVSPEYFAVLEIPLSRGRNFTREESLTCAPVAMVSEALARQLWPDSDALGQSLQLARDARSTLSWQTPLRFPTAHIIAIACDVNTGFLENNSHLLAYFPTNSQAAKTVLLIKVAGDPEQARQQIDKALTEAAPGGVNVIHKLQSVLTLRLYPFCMMYWVSAMLGVLAFLLTISGIHGVISYLVEQCLHEMGIRMTLGASGSAMVTLVLRQSLRLAVCDVLIGAALALAASLLLSSLLTMIDAFDRQAYAMAILCVVVCCLAAAFFPSLRAARVDPVRTLRHD